MAWPVCARRFSAAAHSARVELLHPWRVSEIRRTSDGFEIIERAAPDAPAGCVARVAVEHMEGGHHLQLEHPQAVAAWMLHHAAA